MHYPTGTNIDDSYEILSFIGEGGMGTVYSASQKTLNRLVALKILDPNYIGDDDTSVRFSLEAKLIARLAHKHIVKCYRLGLPDDGTPPYIAMELLHGRTLRDLLNEQSKLSWQRAVSIASQVAEAIANAHASGVIHRDLKPNNIFLLDQPEPDFVKVLDFGLAKLMEKQEKDLTRSGILLGTVNYMSPEQCQGKSVDHRSDIYSLGCILYEAVSGTVPFTADSPIGVLHKHTNEAPPPLPENLPSSLRKVISTALAKDANNRYQSMQEFQADLKAISDGKAGTNELGRLVQQSTTDHTSNSRSKSLLLVFPILLFLILLDPIAGNAAALLVRIIGAKEGASVGVSIAKSMLANGLYNRSAEITLKACEDVTPNVEDFGTIEIAALESKIQYRLGNLEESQKLAQNALEQLAKIGGTSKDVSEKEVSALQETLDFITLPLPDTARFLVDLGYRYLAVGKTDLAALVCEKLCKLSQSLRGEGRTAAQTAAPYLCDSLATTMLKANKKDEAAHFLQLEATTKSLINPNRDPNDEHLRFNILMSLSTAMSQAGFNACPPLLEALKITGPELTDDSKLQVLQALCPEERLKAKEMGAAHEEHVKQALELCDRDRERLWNARAHALLELAWIYEHQGKAKQTEELLASCEEIVTRHNAIDSAFSFTFAYLHASCGNRTAAEKYCRLARTMPHEWGTDYCIDSVEFLLLSNEKNYAGAEAKLRGMYESYKNKWDEPTKRGYYEKLAQVLEATGKKDEAERVRKQSPISP